MECKHLDSWKCNFCTFQLNYCNDFIITKEDNETTIVYRYKQSDLHLVFHAQKSQKINWYLTKMYFTAWFSFSHVPSTFTFLAMTIVWTMVWSSVLLAYVTNITAVALSGRCWYSPRRFANFFILFELRLPGPCKLGVENVVKQTEYTHSSIVYDCNWSRNNKKTTIYYCRRSMRSSKN